MFVDGMCIRERKVAVHCSYKNLRQIFSFSKYKMCFMCLHFSLLDCTVCRFDSWLDYTWMQWSKLCYVTLYYIIIT